MRNGSLIAKLFWLNYMPNKCQAVFYNIWIGKGSMKFKMEMQKDFLRSSDYCAAEFLNLKLQLNFLWKRLLKPWN